MGNNVVKVAPEVDGYLLIDEGGENRVLAWGNRAEMVEHLFHFDDRKPDRIYEFDHSHPENRLKRADERGSSSMLGSARWDAETVGLYGGGGYRDTVKRVDLPEVFRRLEALVEPDDDYDISDLLLPAEED